MPLTDVRARTAKSGEKAYKLADEKGLSLLVHPNGSRYWRLKYRNAGKEKQLALGVYPEVTLAQARELTLEARVLLKTGNDPGTERKATKARAVESAAVTFEGVTREWMENRGDKWAPSYAEKVGAILGNNLFPRIGATYHLYYRANAPGRSSPHRGAGRLGDSSAGPSLGGGGVPLRNRDRPCDR